MTYTNRITHYLDLALPDLPSQLDGLRIAHLSDLHIRRHRHRHDQIADQLIELRPDLIVFTGDYITWPGSETVAFDAMRRLCEQLTPPLGMFGVFGNHDSAVIRRVFASLPITWLSNSGHKFDNLPLELWGMDTTFPSRSHDSVLLAEQVAAHNGHHCPRDYDEERGNRPVRILLGHMAAFLPTAADLGMDIMLAGHTHGGQCRLPGARAIINSCDLPLELTAGLLRHRQTICAVSRGLGEIFLPFRLFCPPQLPIYTLRHGARPGQYTNHMVAVTRW